MPGGVLQIVGVVALLIVAGELWLRALPERLADLPQPAHEPEVDALRRSGAL